MSIMKKISRKRNRVEYKKIEKTINNSNLEYFLRKGIIPSTIVKDDIDSDIQKAATYVWFRKNKMPTTTYFPKCLSAYKICSDLNKKKFPQWWTPTDMKMVTIRKSQFRLNTARIGGRRHKKKKEIRVVSKDLEDYMPYSYESQVRFIRFVDKVESQCHKIYRHKKFDYLIDADFNLVKEMGGDSLMFDKPKEEVKLEVKNEVVEHSCFDDSIEFEDILHSEELHNAVVKRIVEGKGEDKQVIACKSRDMTKSDSDVSGKGEDKQAIACKSRDMTKSVSDVSGKGEDKQAIACKSNDMTNSDSDVSDEDMTEDFSAGRKLAIVNGSPQENKVVEEEVKNVLKQEPKK